MTNLSKANLPKTNITVPMSCAKKLINQAIAAGCDENVLLQTAGLSPNSFNNQLDLSAYKYGELYQQIMKVTQHEWFGMFSGGRVPLGTFRMLCLALIQCKSLQQAIIRAGEFSEICRGVLAKFNLEIMNDRAYLTLSPLRSSSVEDFDSLLQVAKPEAILTTLLAWHRLLQWLASKELPLIELHLTFSKSQMGQPFVQTQSETILFNQGCNGLTYNIDCLNFPVVQDYESLMAFLKTAPYYLITEDPKNIPLADKVRTILKKDVSGLLPGADEIASKLNMSTTTLRRQLQHELTSYQKIKDECRMQAAFHYLGCPELSNGDIAERLGFDEPSAFFRSFKKWTGKTPGEYRNSTSCTNNTDN